MQAIDESKCLFHHGILGQKWGKKNGPPYPLSGSAHSSAEKKAGWKKSLDKTTDAQKAAIEKRKNDVKNRRAMSDEELRSKINRLKMEQEYKALVEADLAPGKRMVKDVITSSGKQVLSSAATGAMKYAGNNLVYNITNDAELANALFNVKTKRDANKEKADSARDKALKKQRDDIDLKTKQIALERAQMSLEDERRKRANS